jgi:hypothetical protein
MRRVHGVFHGLEPVGVELRLNEDLAAAVFAKPHVEVSDQRRRI